MPVYYVEQLLERFRTLVADDEQGLEEDFLGILGVISLRVLVLRPQGQKGLGL